MDQPLRCLRILVDRREPSPWLSGSSIGRRLDTSQGQQVHALQHAAFAASIGPDQRREPPQLEREVLEALEVLEVDAVDHGACQRGRWMALPSYHRRSAARTPCPSWWILGPRM